MNILIDIGHPAHVHLYRHFYFDAKARGHRIYVTVKDVHSARRLLDSYKIPYRVIGRKGRSKGGKLFQQLWFDLRTLMLVLSRKIDIGLGSSITNTHVSLLTPMKSIVFDDDDDEVQPLFVKYAHPFASALISPDSLRGKRKRKDTIYYPGYHELAYLHPDRFVPDPSVLERSGIREGETYFVMRFNEFLAHHDYDVTGLSDDQKERLINTLSAHGKVFITTESEDSNRFSAYRIKIDPTEIHSFLYYATMFVGDSQTMTSEAGILGTPAVRCNSLVKRLSYLSEQEKVYGLNYSFVPAEFDRMHEKIVELLATPGLKETWREKSLRLAREKLELSGFMLWFVENYPESERYREDRSLYNPGNQV